MFFHHLFSFFHSFAISFDKNDQNNLRMREKEIQKWWVTQKRNNNYITKWRRRKNAKNYVLRTKWNNNKIYAQLLPYTFSSHFLSVIVTFLLFCCLFFFLLFFFYSLFFFSLVSTCLFIRSKRNDVQNAIWHGQWKHSMGSRYCVPNKTWNDTIATKNVKLKCWWQELVSACVCARNKKIWLSLSRGSEENKSTTMTMGEGLTFFGICLFCH